jgi:insertion element IS1 protein InsB
MILICKRCQGECKKSGFQKNGKQKYKCRFCNLYQQDYYVYSACKPEIHDQFSRMNRIGCGSIKMAHFLGVSINTLQKWVGKAIELESNHDLKPGEIYDIDELQTGVGKRQNKVWITYAWNIKEKRALALNVGGRSADDLRVLIDKTLQVNPKKINTDKHPTYGCLIPGNLHSKGKRKANHIEREHRNMRKDIANLIQETMCFAKNTRMLEARIRWYFWAETNPYFFLK